MYRTIRNVFAAQLASATPTSGDYLENRSKEALFHDWLPMLKGSDIMEKAASFDVALNAKIQEWKQHAGERQLYFMIDSGGIIPQVIKVWESELEQLDTLFNIHIDLDHVIYAGDGFMPVFKARDY